MQIDYDPDKISYGELLSIFWESHDPTFPSFSRQYMSAIFCHDEEQERLALESRDREQARSSQKVYTEIIPFTEFYPAEDYHQKYALQRNADLMSEFRAMYSSIAGIIASTAAARVNGYLAGYGILKDLQNELDSYGLSEAAGKILMTLMKESHRIPCSR